MLSSCYAYSQYSSTTDLSKLVILHGPGFLSIWLRFDSSEWIIDASLGLVDFGALSLPSTRVHAL